MAAELPVRDGFASVLALKAIPALANAHPDDLIELALRTTERRFPAGTRLASTADGECSLFFLLEGRVRELRGERELARLDAPALPALLAVLAGDAEPTLFADTDVVALEIARPALLEVLEDEFELWVAALRHVCRCALEAGEPRADWEAGIAEPEPCADPADLAERIALLRRTVPFSGLPIALLGRFAVEMEEVTAAGATVLWEPGDPATHLLAILAGHVDVEEAGRGQTERHGAGALLGLPDALACTEYRFRLRARGPVQALRLDAEALVDALEDDAASAVELLCVLARQWRGGS